MTLPGIIDKPIKSGTQFVCDESYAETLRSIHAADAVTRNYLSPEAAAVAGLIQCGIDPDTARNEVAKGTVVGLNP